MLKTKIPYFAFCLLTSILVLSGCNSKTVVSEKDEAKLVNGSASGVAVVERTCTVAEYDRCVAQLTLMNKDLVKYADENEKCSMTLTAYQEAEATQKTANPKINEILKIYTTTTEQKEYPFDACGKVSSFYNKPWFANFRTALENKKVPFSMAGRMLAVEDFTGGCASSEANVAFFMGAETAGVGSTDTGSEILSVDDIYEFHLLKYDITSNTIEETIMANGICTDENCPAVFGNREGAVIPMKGISKTEECNYKYFFSQNILVKEGCNAR